MSSNPWTSTKFRLFGQLFIKLCLVPNLVNAVWFDTTKKITGLVDEL